MTTQNDYVSAAPKQDDRTIGERITDFLAEYGIFLVLLAIVTILAIVTPLVRGEQYFLRPQNLINVALQASVNAIIAVGMTFIITSGGIDLSVGSIVALCGVLAALVMRETEGMFGSAWLGLGVALGVGALAGLFNGFLITRFKLPAFIATLGTMGIFRGLALIVSDGRSIYGFGSSFIDIFGGDFVIPFTGLLTSGGIDFPKAVLVALIVALIGWFILTQTRFGKYTIAIGGSEETSRLAGIAVEKYRLGIYTFGGFLTGIAGVLLLARLRSGDPTFGTLFELDAIAAAVIGGTSLSGGEGSVWGTIVGALIISVVRNALNILNMPTYYQQLVIGSVIILAIMLDQWRKQQSAKQT
jgi:ribose/xylose/arabinose/galactoside ABC-type transport system permease subunit